MHIFEIGPEKFNYLRINSLFIVRNARRPTPCYSSRKRMKHGKKSKKSRLLEFEKNVKKVKKNVEVIIYAYSPEDHDDHRQSVLLSFAQYQGHYILTKNEQFLPARRYASAGYRDRNVSCLLYTSPSPRD